MRRNIIQQIINEELLREFDWNNAINKTGEYFRKGVDKGTEFYQDNIAPTVDKAVDKTGQFIKGTVVPKFNDGITAVKNAFGNPFNDSGVYANIAVPDNVSEDDVAKMNSIGGSRTFIINDLLKKDEFKSLKELRKFLKQCRPYVELTTYRELNGTYPTSHSQLDLWISKDPRLSGTLNTYIDDGGYSIVTNNCSNATYACICKMLGKKIPDLDLRIPRNVRTWFRGLGATDSGVNSDGGRMQTLRLSLKQAIKGLYYIIGYIGLGHKN